MLELGLSRISRLVAAQSLPWRAIHVAGTNGKGSVCAYASAMLKRSRVPCGRFTSPHLIDRWDCISINEEPIAESVFNRLDEKVRQKNQDENIQATAFELLTATAFEAFTEHGVQVGVVEVGLGGTLDATNILVNPLATVITSIGMDHEALLGNTIEKIAWQKAGIMKPDIKCFVDATNPSTVRDVFEKSSKEVVPPSLITDVRPDDAMFQENLWSSLPRSNYEPHQQMAICLAYSAATLAMNKLHISFANQDLIPAIRETTWPGRLQRTTIEKVTGRKSPVLLDGAHNPQSAAVLGSYVDGKLREGSSPATWVLAASQTKDLQAMIPLMIRDGDNLIAVEFSPVAGMPWVQPTKPKEILKEARATIKLGDAREPISVLDALYLGTAVSQGGPLVIAGSLYLVSDVLRLLRDTAKDENTFCRYQGGRRYLLSDRVDVV